MYLAAARRLGAAPEETAVYEDALYAAQTAKAAGFYVAGIFDRSAESVWDELRSLADESLTGWMEGLTALLEEQKNEKEEMEVS